MALNVLGTELEACSLDPLTGFFRNGSCDTCGEDNGMHTVCALMSKEFLEFSAQRGNDLRTPYEEFKFPGLRPGDMWCICMDRWLEAYEAGVAPLINLKACHLSLTEFVDQNILEQYSIEQGANR